jgi:hypothetical protein
MDVPSAIQPWSAGVDQIPVRDFEIGSYIKPSTYIDLLDTAVYYENSVHRTRPASRRQRGRGDECDECGRG